MDNIFAAQLMLKTAALEIETQQHKPNLVKVAGIFKALKNVWDWITGSQDPEFRQDVEAMKEHSGEVTEAVTELNNLTTGVKTAIQEQDVERLKDLLSNALPIINQATDALARLGEATKAASQDLSEAAQKAHIRRVKKDFHQDTEITKQLTEQLPPEFAAEFGGLLNKNINVPVSSSTWINNHFKEIYVSTGSKQNLIKRFTSILKEHGYSETNGYDTSMAEKVATKSVPVFVDRVCQAIFANGIITRCEWAVVSKNRAERRANEIMYTVKVPRVEFPLPNNKKLVLACVMELIDLKASVDDIDKLSWRRITNITKLVGTDDIKRKAETSRVLISLSNAKDEYRLKFAKILTSALRSELKAECSSIHHEPDTTEIESDIEGDLSLVANAVYDLSNSVVTQFNKVASSGIKVQIKPNESSSINLADLSVLEQSHIKVASDIRRTKHG